MKARMFLIPFTFLKEAAKAMMSFIPSLLVAFSVIGAAVLVPAAISRRG